MIKHENISIGFKDELADYIFNETKSARDVSITDVKLTSRDGILEQLSEVEKSGPLKIGRVMYMTADSKKSREITSFDVPEITVKLKSIYVRIK